MRKIAAAGLLLMCTTAVLEAAPASKLQKVFQFETLGVRVAYLESLTGPAMHEFPGAGGTETRDYRVDGCLVGAGIDQGTVRYLRLSLTPRCNFNLGSFLGNGYGTTTGLTVGKFARGLFGASAIRVQSSCVYLCGNAADPSVDFTWEGPHAANFVGVTLGVTLVNGPALDGSGKWTDAMRRRDGQAYIEQTRFNCDRKWDAEGVQAFAPAQVNQVTIGFDLPASDYANHCR